jgi:hypothetical protein
MVSPSVISHSKLRNYIALLRKQVVMNCRKLTKLRERIAWEIQKPRTVRDMQHKKGG